MRVGSPRPIEPEGFWTFRTRALAKFLLGSLLTVGAALLVIAYSLHRIPLLGKYLVILVVGSPAVLACIGTLELITGQHITDLSAQWDAIPLATRRFYSVVICVVLIGIITVVVLTLFRPLG